jgi:hypothetical protein
LKKAIFLLILGGMIAAPIVLLILPPDFFDNGESICPSVYFFDKECFGCGMTRATMHMIHFEFQKAWTFNRLSFFLVPVLGYFYVSIGYKLVKKIKAPASFKN